MGVFTRFKRDAAGFRAIIELWETTPKDRREKMIEVGRAEDPEFTEEVLRYLMTFQDVLDLPDLELAEVLAAAKPRMVGVAIQPLNKEIQKRFLRNAPGRLMSEIRDFLETSPTLREVGGAQLNLITVARALEKKGLVKTKRIPFQQPDLKARA